MSTFDRRTLIARSAAAATMAALATRLPAAAIPPLEVDESAIADAVSGFALDLYRELREVADGNMLVSPYSISMALAMTYAGAGGDTKTQMEETLGFDGAYLAIHRSFAELTTDLTERGNVEEDEDEGTGEGGLRIANALWGERTYPFAADFIDALAADYGAGLQLVDFEGDPDGAREDINAWVEEQTKDRIQDIVPPGVIDATTRLVLANAIWFYGVWRSTFEESNTRDEPFHLLDGDTVDVPFMVQTESFAYAAIDDMQVVDLPYESDGFSMTLFLPDEDQFDAVESALDASALQEAIAVLEYTDVRLFLPKFEFEYATSLVDALQALGITDAFDADRADFSGMTDPTATPEPGETNRLVIGDVLHKAFIAVDEEGTEAAAATVVVMEVASAPPPEDEPIELRLDRPFLFAIRDRETGAILFLGRVTDPRG